MEGQTDINACIVSEQSKQNFKIMFIDILTFLGLDIVLYCLRNQYTKNQINRIIRSHKGLVLKKFKKSTCYGRTDILLVIIELLRFLNRT